MLIATQTIHSLYQIGSVVYFDLQIHAHTCVCMVKNKEKHFKITQSNLLSWAQDSHVRLMQHHAENWAF